MTQYHHSKNHTTTCQTDSSGIVDYRFNSLGFRGDEPDLASKNLVFVCGCSYTFGLGLNWNETWAYRLQQLLECRDGEKTELLNFAQGGASNDYIARTLISQIRRVKPRLVVAQFTFANRCELVGDEAIDCVGPWNESEDALAYYAFYREAYGLMNASKNILLLAAYCQNLSIPFLVWTVQPREELLATLTRHPWTDWIHEEFRLLGNRMASDSLLERKYFVDFAADNAHPGPKSNGLFADYLAAILVDVIGF
jgi:hypothetical protein